VFVVAIAKQTVCPKEKAEVGTVKHAGGQVPVLSQLQYFEVPISVPLIQTWELSSPDTQIWAEIGVQAAWTSKPLPIPHSKQNNRKKGISPRKSEAHVALCNLNFSSAITYLPEMLWSSVILTEKWDS
jgi:hypothetical protein